MEYLITESELEQLKAGKSITLAYLGRKDKMARMSDNTIKMIPLGQQIAPSSPTE
jgi:hypothetical protein